MASLQHFFKQPATRRRDRGWSGFRSAALLTAGLITGLSASAFAQNDDPDGLTVPEGLKSATEKTTEQQTPETPRTRIGEDAQQDRVVGELVGVDGRTLTVRHEDRQSSFLVPAGVKVTRNGDPVRLSQLQPEDVIRIERGVTPDSVTAVVAVSPAPAGDRDPDQQLRSQRRQAADQQPPPRSTQVAQPAAAGGRVWVVLLDTDGEAAESGLLPGDVIIVANRSMLQTEGALQGLASGLFPLRANADGEVIVSPNAAGVSVLGTGAAAVPTGVNIGVGSGVDPRSNTPNPNNAIPPRSTVGDQNFGPPIGRRQDPGDRNYGPPIGTGNQPAPGAGQNSPQQPQSPQQQPPQAPPAP